MNNYRKKICVFVSLLLVCFCNSAIADGGYGDSVIFALDVSTQTTSHYGDSAVFALDSNPRLSGKYSDSSVVSVDSFRVNRAWADSDSIVIMTKAAQTRSSEYIGAWDLHRRGIEGNNITIGVIEYSQPYNHYALLGRLLEPFGGDYGESDTDNKDHSLMVAGLAAGEITEPNWSAPATPYTGVAPKASVKTGCVELHPNIIFGGMAQWEDEFQGLADNGAEVITCSVGDRFDVWGAESLEEKINHIVDENKVTICIAVGDIRKGTEIKYEVPACPANAYNCIAVGALRDSKNNFRNATDPVSYDLLDDNSTNGPGRNGICKPDVVAPADAYWPTVLGDWQTLSSGNGQTSAATPHVAGAVALLIEAAKNCEAGGNNLTFVDGVGVDPRAVKSALLTGADKNIKALVYDSNWVTVGTRSWKTSGPTQPLDYALGAGGLNVLESYKILLSQDDIIFGKSIKRKTYFGHIAWIEGGDSTVTADIGYLPVGSEFTATLAWNAHPDLINNLDMMVYCDGNIVAESTSVIDNVEHVWLETQKEGDFSVEVRFEDHTSGITELENFALSYRTASNRIIGDFNDDGRIDMCDLGYLADRWLNNVKIFTEADLSGDGFVNLKDFAAFAENWLVGIEK